ncbi:MAG: GNAT family N-acetyltransferase, partial [Vicinamibacterales bacterium]
SNARFVEARARVDPSAAAAWIEVAGAYAMFDGVDSPLTQTFGLGLFGDTGDRELARLEAFFDGRGAAVHHEVSPLAGVELAARLARRGYVPEEFTTVLCRPLGGSPDGDTTPAGGVAVEPLPDGQAGLFGDVAARGWAEFPEVAPFVADLSAVFAHHAAARCYLAVVDGVPAGTGVLTMHEGVAVLAGASTVPEARCRGAQRALLAARLADAAAAGCDLAMIATAPGSASQRNAERRGFRIAYTSAKWFLARG